MCLLIVALLPRAFFAFLLRPVTVVIRQTRQAVRAINQSIFLRCLWGFLTYYYRKAKNRSLFESKYFFTILKMPQTVFTFTVVNVMLRDSNPRCYDYESGVWLLCHRWRGKLNSRLEQKSTTWKILTILKSSLADSNTSVLLNLWSYKLRRNIQHHDTRQNDNW